MLGIGTPGWQELVIIGAIFLLLFGARRLPEIGQSLGKGIREFKNSLTGSDDEPRLSSGDQSGNTAETPRGQEEKR